MWLQSILEGTHTTKISSSIYECYVWFADILEISYDCANRVCEYSYCCFFSIYPWVNRKHFFLVVDMKQKSFMLIRTRLFLNAGATIGQHPRGNNKGSFEGCPCTELVALWGASENYRNGASPQFLMSTKGMLLRKLEYQI
ncbi:hypothetical protein AABB24_037855 [Solanum stoloniferum]|uniref:Uncharacterized protein n=1 Tax=Solanum stoloniferum TaxID=62892 RepID=A0ABD2QW72_9SOLN